MIKTQVPIRHLTPYERTHLAKFGISEDDAQCQPYCPVEYLTNRADFAKRTFIINQHTLIPRPETEELVDATLLWLAHQKYSELYQVIEIGTGSGAIAITLDLNCTNHGLNIIATDISSEAIEIAKKNIKLHQAKRVSTQQANLLDFWKQGKNIDILIANLPYIPSQRVPLLERSVKDYEPLIALDGGEDGFELIRSLLKQAPSILKQSGIIFLEIDYTHPGLLQQEFSSIYQIETWKSQLSLCIFAKLVLK